MIKSKSEMDGKIEIDLTGPQGNAFFLMGTAEKLAKQMGYTDKDLVDLRVELMSSDYENLVEVFDKHFGEVVTLYR